MRRLLLVFASTLGVLLVMDLAVAGILALAERRGVAGSLVEYFEYGRSVPGKLERWLEKPDMRGNLLDVGWKATDDDRLTGPGAPQGVVRAYGMSFVNNILRAAEEQAPGIPQDRHSGPGAPPNYTYAYFLELRRCRCAWHPFVFGPRIGRAQQPDMGVRAARAIHVSDLSS